MWVRSKYTSELAVLAAWVSLLIPWNVVYHSSASVEEFPAVEGTIFFLRFAFFELQLRQQTAVDGEIAIENFDDPLDTQYAGTELVGGLYVTSPPTSSLVYDGTLLQATLVWTVAAIALGLAFALSLALYFRTEATVERLPASDVRVMGALLGVGAVAMAASSWLYYLERDTTGIPIPIGVFVIGAFSFVLLRMKEVPEEPAS